MSDSVFLNASYELKGGWIPQGICSSSAFCLGKPTPQTLLRRQKKGRSLFSSSAKSPCSFLYSFNYFIQHLFPVLLLSLSLQAAEHAARLWIMMNCIWNCFFIASEKKKKKKKVWEEFPFGRKFLNCIKRMLFLTLKVFVVSYSLTCKAVINIFLIYETWDSGGFIFLWIK